MCPGPDPAHTRTRPGPRAHPDPAPDPAHTRTRPGPRTHPDPAQTPRTPDPGPYPAPRPQTPGPARTPPPGPRPGPYPAPRPVPRPQAPAPRPRPGMSVTISLSDLANLCISHPEPGVVNFLALRSLLLAILRHLGIQDVQTEERPELWTVPEAAARARSLGPYQQLEHRLQELEQQVRELSRLPTGTELLERSKRDSKAVSDMWSLLQLRKSSETNREGVGKVMSLMEEMVLEINSLKNFKNTVEDRITHIGNNLDTVSNHVALVSELLTKAPEQLQRFVTWNILQTTLVESPTDASPDTESSPPSLLPGQPAQPPGVEAQASVATVQAHKVTMPQESERIDQVSRIDPSSLAEDLEPSEKPPDTLTSSALFKTSEDGSQYYPETVSALKRIRHVSDGQPALVHRVSALEKTLSELVSGDRPGKGAESSGDLDGNDMRAQVSHLRDMVKNIDEELKELRKFQPTSSEAGSQTQQQLDKLGSVLEKIMSSSCALLGMSLGLETEATCPVCSLDVSQDASNLCQRFQKLQDTVNTLTGDGPKEQDLQNNIGQLQAECEKLNNMISQLLQDELAQQRNIEALFETMNRLEKKCGEGNISRSQFDAVTDQMNKMIQGLLNKICSQEKDWNSIVATLSAEMECKLDRIELDPLKKQLEDRWRTIRKLLLSQKGFEPEGAAGLKKQLINHFHCLSCDRPLDIKMPSSDVISLPMPTYPITGYRSQRYDIEHVRRRSKGWTADRAQPNTVLDRNVSYMQRLHSNLCRQIERVQNHFKGSVKAVSPFMRPLLHMGCPVATSPPRKLYESLIKSERITDLMDNFPTTARSCGGSHTLTSAHHRRCPKVYEYHPILMPDEDHSTKREEPSMTHTDAQAPKARTTCRLPSIGGKDATKYKLVCCPSQKGSSSKLCSSRLTSAHLPSVPWPGTAMAEQSLSLVERDCQCLADSSLPCPCVGNLMCSAQLSLTCPSAEQPVESLDLPTHSGIALLPPVKPLHI